MSIKRIGYNKVLEIIRANGFSNKLNYASGTIEILNGKKVIAQLGELGKRELVVIKGYEIFL